MPYVARNNVSCYEVAENVTAKYIEALTSLASGTECEIFITNVPAPMKIPQASDAANLERGNLIKVCSQKSSKIARLNC